ncbi:MAG: chorismate mutase [Deltaproteobacteria bacterium]|nr:chorismate mutase [Deltaproteobacteria bacterium]
MSLTPLKGFTPAASTPRLIAGPCAAETREQVLEAARALAGTPGLMWFRTGVWKPRTRSASFEGAGEPALAWLAEVRELGLEPCLEVALPRHVEQALAAGIDCFWIGTRTVGSPFAVQELADALAGCGEVSLLVKNPLSPDLGLWLGALERLERAGLTRLGGMHRGFLMHSQEGQPRGERYRFSPRWRLVLALRRLLPDLPIFADPSHLAGHRELVGEVAQMALDLGLDGLMLEVHPRPDEALCDAEQQLDPPGLGRLLGELILRRPESPAPAFGSELEKLRAAIDEADAAILEAVARRLGIVEEIARLKQGERVTPFQRARMIEVLESWREAGTRLGLDDRLTTELYELLHEAALEVHWKR